MAECADLIKEIDNLPSKYFSEVINFIGYLKQKVKNEINDEVGAYMDMAADIERENEASEWCNAYFGPIDK